jgi:hypothetical protein
MSLYPEEFRAIQETYLTGSKPTDMQFNIGRIEGRAPRGLDVIYPGSGERHYVTRGSSLEAERALAGNKLLAVLGRASIEGLPEDISVYEVPKGARLLIKTLKTAPYAPRYMQRLAESAGRMLHELQELSPDMFGIRLTDIGVGHNGANDEDDARLFVVPPLAEGSDEPVSLEGLRIDTLLEDPRLIAAITHGFLGGDK